jgi:hypothetical protein
MAKDSKGIDLPFNRLGDSYKLENASKSATTNHEQILPGINLESKGITKGGQSEKLSGYEFGPAGSYKV